jgi:hypothetical protein
MSKPLPGAWDLIKNSWRDFVKTWDTTIRYSAWIILVGLLQSAYVFIPDGKDPNGWYWAGIVAYIAGIALMLWVMIRLYQVTLTLDAGGKITEKTTEKAVSLILPLLLVGILSGVATLGAFLLLVLPGIYVGIRLGFSVLSFMDKDKRGRAALADSWALTKDRFWAVLWRQFAGGVVFALLIWAVSIAALLIVGLVAGGAKFEAMMAGGGPKVAVGAVTVLITQAIQAAFMPLLFFYQIKIYRALRQTA